MMSIESNNINEDHEKTNTCSGEKRRESVNLLDMTDIPALQPNTADQSINIWQKTEPEQQRACSVMVTCSDYENLQDHHQSMLKMDPIKHITTRAEKQQQPAKIMPTRLPTPRRPPLQTQTSLDHLTNSGQRQVTPPVQMNPTPPSSPSRRRIRQTSIARLSKIQPPATTTTTNGKANRDLAEFDPLISPVKEAAKKSPSSNDASIEKKKTQEPKTPNSRIPQYSTCRKQDEMIKTTLAKEDIIIMPTKLREPKISVPSSQRRTSLIQDQLEKERENVQQSLCVNLISAQGEITQPDETEAKSPIQERLSHHLIDISGDSAEEANDEPPVEYKRELETAIEGIPAKAALNKYKPYLSPYEKMEIQRYPVVYCVGSHAKKHWATTDQSSCNYGYDDEKGDYQIVIRDHLNYRYEMVESLGKGSFGQVIKCRDLKLNPENNNLVAVKIIRNKKRFHAQAQTEVKILEQLMKWDPKNKYYNVRMLDSFYFRDHLCIVFECLSLNLYEVLQQNSYQGFSMGLVKRFSYQILTSLCLLNEHNLIHCDLKPENILLRHPDRSGIRIIDFGSSCLSNERVYTYIQSRFYRAPEVILGLEYGMPIDMWSTGCILAELYTGKPLFPGENELDQLACIMQLIGVPDKSYLDQCSRKKQFFDLYDHPKRSINSKGKRRKPGTITFSESLKRSDYETSDNDFVDFMSKCLIWEPSKRITPIEALNHPWLRTTKKTASSTTS